MVEDGERVMMTQDRDGLPGWKFPGGHIEAAELLLDAAKREIREETGFEVEPSGLLLIEDYFNEKRPQEHNSRIYLLAQLVGGEKKIRKDEVKTLRWFAREELSRMREDQVYPRHFLALQRFLSGAHTPIDVIVRRVEK